MRIPLSTLNKCESKLTFQVLQTEPIQVPCPWLLDIWRTKPVVIRKVVAMCVCVKSKDKSDIVRELIQNENILLDQRRSHFAVLQGLLWASIATLAQENRSDNIALICTIASTGALHALVTCYALQLTGCVIMKLISENKMRKEDLVIGWYPECPTPQLWWYGWCNHASSTPTIMCLAWVTFLVLLLVEKYCTPEHMNQSKTGNVTENTLV